MEPRPRHSASGLTPRYGHSFEDVDVKIYQPRGDDPAGRIDYLGSVVRRNCVGEGGDPAILEGDVPPVMDLLSRID